jgi:sRNA-binding carbon storage regulator CsrA
MNPMPNLALTRKTGERIVITTKSGEEIIVCLSKVCGYNKAVICVEADAAVVVDRWEIDQRKREAAGLPERVNR